MREKDTDGTAAEPAFRFIDPPFQFNSPKVAVYPTEVTGHYILRKMAHRLGWSSLAGKRVLDFGCGVRSVRTIVNLGLPIGRYVGVDVNKASIAWLSEHVEDKRFGFLHINDANTMYNPKGTAGDGHDALETLTDERFDVVLAYSVMTHQQPDGFERIASVLRRVQAHGGAFYFTGLLSDEPQDFAEQAANPGGFCVYNRVYLRSLLDKAGWRVEAMWDGEDHYQQPAVLCRPV
ncbi:class I SAM-dependent methyltransferase [Methylorubrum salsuginis]|uniref:Methyltransferase domain-containing protein n=1 Tax=Methylorubrum salsuginis TaxID=414703 RepID=A0A1I4EBE7_9HYPH|nr:class I SAM-dependent methyltransferase [Methylorubrum salsuginis]SFL03144.1 Methyltransferase domain-containing protein [Methylorubrum salsuginis]